MRHEQRRQDRHQYDQHEADRGRRDDRRRDQVRSASLHRGDVIGMDDEKASRRTFLIA